jgi:hypothetical protein
VTDTRGGETLVSLAPLPAHVVATEGWEPNVAIAKRRLEHLGVEVRRQDGGTTPAADGEFGLVLNRHGQIDAEELARVLDTRGRLLTQQVAVGNDNEFNQVLGVPAPTVRPRNGYPGLSGGSGIALPGPRRSPRRSPTSTSELSSSSY